MLKDRNPVMTVFAGTNGAGKSTLSLQMKSHIGEVVDPDQIARELKPDNPRGADLSAGKIAVKRIRSLIEASADFAIETTLSGTFVLKHMQLAKTMSYDVVMHYIGLQDVQMHIDRVASRVEQGGHWISEKDIRWRYGQSLKNLRPAIAIANQVFIIDNTNLSVIIGEIQHNKLIFCEDHIPSWAENVISEFRMKSKE